MMSRSIGLQFFFLPRAPGGVLAHLEARDGDAAGVCRLARGEQDPGRLEHVHRFEVRGHVGAFGHRVQPFLTSASASGPSSSFWVAHGSAASHGTFHGVWPSWKVAPLNSSA
jgi:hypothetical protein